MTDAAESSDLGTSERVREKMLKMSQALNSPTAATKGEISAVRAQCEATVKEVREESDRRVRVAEAQIQASEGRAQVAEGRVQALEEQMERTNQRMLNAEETARTLERRVREVEEQGNRRTRAAEERAWDLEQRAIEAEKIASDCKRQWIVERQEIHMSKEVLGKGGWGEVKVALFRGTRVAAKLLYSELQYEFYHDLFIREMNMAARIRHPNLVQFIGASLEGEMVILSELMATSLRNHITVNQSTPEFCRAIALDTAKGLSYLHSIQPDPIIHRDVSSANVLLEPLSDNRWKAKITDYGSVNFQRKLKTVGPGSPVYAAPEVHSPDQQSPKMDIFSFGILMVEIWTRRFPEPDAREGLIASIKDEGWLGLIRRCIDPNKDRRYTAADIIAELNLSSV